MTTHEHLLRIVKRLPSDFQPYGERDRDIAEPSEDCSCGCRHFLVLDGELGYDWGVCANPASPRCGLLTFEHQGCPQFEPEQEPEEPIEHAAPEPFSGEEETEKPAKHVRIELDEFAIALEGFPGGELSYVLDTQTGEVLPLLEVSRKGPFRGFKDVVHRDLDLRDRWFAFRDDAMAEYGRTMLAVRGIEVEWIGR